MNQKNAIEILEILKKEYPDAKCSLNFNSPFELMVAVALSAQCTDERVNKVTAEIFKNYNTPQDFANMPLKDIENMIHSCGFYRNKAKNLRLASQKVLTNFNGEVPKTMEELMSIPGVGRKSANVIMLEAFNNPQGIAVDTHAKRLSNRIGFSKEQDPQKIEQDLIKLFPKEYYHDVNHIFMWHGRNTCKAQSPDCENCCIKYMCKSFNG